MYSFEFADYCVKFRWRLIEEAGRLKALLLDFFVKSILKHSFFVALWRNDDVVSKPNIVLIVRRSSPNLDLQPNSDAEEAMEHVPCNCCCRICAVFAIREDSDGYIVLADPT